MGNKLIILTLFVLVFSGVILAEEVSLFDRYQEFSEKKDFSGFLRFLETEEAHGLNCEKAYLKALALFEQLKFWQDRKQWEEFFERKIQIRDEIIQLCSFTEGDPFLCRLRGKFLLWRLFDFLKEKKITDAEIELVALAQKVNSAQKEEVDFLKSIIFYFSNLEDKKMRKQFSDIYVGVLKDSRNPELLLAEVRVFIEKDDLEGAFALAKAYLGLSGKDQEYFLRSFLGEFGCFGLAGGCDPYFGEYFFSKYHTSYGRLNADLLYLRGYNLEKGFEYQKAKTIYKKFLTEFPQDPLIPEVRFRLGFLLFYQFRNMRLASLVFKHPGFAGDSYFQDLVTQHCALIEKNGILSEPEHNTKVFFDTLFSKEGDFSGKVSLVSIPSRAFAGTPLSIKALVAASGTGCLVPNALFLWSGDFGDVRVVTNTNVLDTSFRQSGFKIARVAEVVSSQVEGIDATLITLYQANISVADEVFSVKKPVTFNLAIAPALPQSVLTYSWVISGPENFSSDQPNVDHVFSSPGIYQGTVTVSLLSRKFVVKSFSFKINAS